MGWRDGFDALRRTLVDAGLAPGDLGWGEQAPGLRWTLRVDEQQDAWLLGGSDHGTWLTWRSFPRHEVGAKEVVASLWELRRRDEPARIPRTLAETAQAAALGVQMMDRSAGWAGGEHAVDAGAGGGSGDTPANAVDVLPASEIKVGTPLDHVGDESGHVLHHFGTSFERRALADEARERPVAGYLLVHVLPVGCRAERVPPAHGHSGGAWRVVLDRPIAAYVESGALRPFVAKDA